MSELWTATFWLATLERSIKSFAGGVLAGMGGDVVVASLDLDWGQITALAGLTALSSVLLSVCSAGINSKNAKGPSLGPETLNPVVEREIDPNG